MSSSEKRDTCQCTNSLSLLSPFAIKNFVPFLTAEGNEKKEWRHNNKCCTSNSRQLSVFPFQQTRERLFKSRNSQAIIDLSERKRRGSRRPLYLLLVFQQQQHLLGWWIIYCLHTVGTAAKQESIHSLSFSLFNDIIKSGLARKLASKHWGNTLPARVREWKWKERERELTNAY